MKPPALLPADLWTHFQVNYFSCLTPAFGEAGLTSLCMVRAAPPPMPLFPELFMPPLSELFISDGGPAAVPFPGPPAPPAPPVVCAHDAVAPTSAKPNPSAITPRYLFILNSLDEDVYRRQQFFVLLVPRFGRRIVHGSVTAGASRRARQHGNRKEESTSAQE